MKILRIIGISVLVAGLVLGGVSSVFAKGPPDEPPGDARHSPGKHGLFGAVLSAVTVTANVTYVISLETKQGTFVITANVTAKYMVPRETKGSKDLATFLGIVDENTNDDLDELVGRRLAVLVTLTNEFAADAIRLMLIPSPDAPPSHAHRVGVVQAFSAGSSITIIDRHGVSHNFDMNEINYRPEGTTAGDIKTSEPWSFVTVVTKGDPKLNPVAKAIVLHEELPDWWPLP
jgi:hypothetical protein